MILNAASIAKMYIGQQFDECRHVNMTGTSQERGKASKILIMSEMEKRKFTSALQVAAATGVSVSTVRKVLGGLVVDKLATSKDVESNGGARPTRFYKLK